MALNWAPSLLGDPSLGLLLIKSTLRPAYHCHLNEVETDELFVNTIHSALKGALCTYMAKERFKALRREFGVNKTDRGLLAGECPRLKARVVAVEGTIKET